MAAAAVKRAGRTACGGKAPTCAASHIDERHRQLALTLSTHLLALVTLSHSVCCTPPPTIVPSLCSWLLDFHPFVSNISLLSSHSHEHNNTMSRLLFVAVLVALLAVSVTAFVSFPSSDIAASPAACPNKCSSHGDCMTSSSTNASTCICTLGYLGVDCSVMASMTPLCWLNSTYCSHWAVQDGYLYQRVWANSTTAAGWAGVMLGSTDGMSGGQSTILTVPSDYAPIAFDGYNTKKGKPTNLTDQCVAPSNVSGGATDSGIDVSFIRLLDTGLAHHFAIPPNGTDSTLGVAWGSSFFEFHGKAAHFEPSIDIVGVATAPSAAAVEKAHTQRMDNRHGRLAALMTPQ